MPTRGPRTGPPFGGGIGTSAETAYAYTRSGSEEGGPLTRITGGMRLMSSSHTPGADVGHAQAGAGSAVGSRSDGVDALAGGTTSLRNNPYFAQSTPFSAAAYGVYLVLTAI